MDDKNIRLSVKNLSVSFRTDAGRVQAVRDISFDLYRGETLALVGESGSGKSVTNRAIMGILAANAVKEGGEIIYDGQDLMKIAERDFHKIRGDKIAMIFQDPMSSLNPIMRVGKQLTEAMIIKGRINQRESRREFNRTLTLIERNMTAAGVDSAEENAAKCAKFNKFEYRHLALQQSYNKAKEAAEDALGDIDDILFRIEKNAYEGLRRDVAEAVKSAFSSFDRYVVHARADELRSILADVKRLMKVPAAEKITSALISLTGRGGKKTVVETDYSAVAEKLGRAREILYEAVNSPMPNFFAMGYYLTFSTQPLPESDIGKLNKFLRKYLDDNFMLDFIRRAEEGLKYSAARSVEAKKEAVKLMDELLPVFKQSAIDPKEAYSAVKRLTYAVVRSIDGLETVKDNLSYTFPSSLKAAADLYFEGIRRNAREERRFEKQTESYSKKAARGRTPVWKVADKKLIDLELAKSEIAAVIERLRDKYLKDISEADGTDFDAKAVALIDYLKEKASGVVEKVTRTLAKNRALKLLEEVGIPEPRKRFRQYPFEFSGGMRQRIVIAIALSANPDVLICDEPTTALDVIIQSQILELINKVKRQRQLSVIFITHDLGVVANTADRVAVMYAGKIVEIGTVDDVFYSPAHPYTWALLSSMPDLETKGRLEAIAGTPPNMIYPPKGDAFAERNRYALKIDFEEQPPMFKISDTHFAATWLLHPDAPKVGPPAQLAERIKKMKEAAE